MWINSNRKKYEKTTFITLFQLVSVLSFAQSYPQYGRDKFALEGGQNGKNYAVILRTSLSKKDLVESTTRMLSKLSLVDENDIMIDDISDETSEFTIPFILRQSAAVGSGLMGSKYIENPTIIQAELRFEFHNNGGVLMVVQNMKNEYLFVKGEMGNRGDSWSEASKEYDAECQALLLTNSLIGKALIFLNTTREEREAFMESAGKYFEDIDSKYAMYQIMVNRGEAEWLTTKDLLNLIQYDEKQSGKKIHARLLQ